MHRLAVSAKRKVLMNPKTAAVYFLAIFFTFILAYHHRLGQENTREIHSLRLLQLRTIDGETQNSNSSKISENFEFFGEKQCKPPPSEAKTDYNTFDIFDKTVANGELFAKTSKSRRKEKLKVYVLPFTHVDPGWLKTFESYTKSTNQILDHMHSFMMKNERMRFMWAEFVFFERWWSLRNESVREDVKKLVDSGRLELATGSWVMTDEANPYFPVSVDNIVEGFQWIYTNFGIKPRTIWSNDPFGYSNSVPYLFKKSGVQRHVINRIHHTIKSNLQHQQAIPFKWRQFFDTTGENDVLTQVLPYTHYDVLNSCGSNPSVCCEFDFKRITHWACPGPRPVGIDENNVKEKAGKLVSELEHMAEMYKAPVILMMHGDDFRFDMIEEWHQQHDNFLPLFDEINKGDQVEIGFGTFNDYFTELEKWNKENPSEAPPTLSGDFFPYMCALGDYWTGYYTTRPFFKRQGRLLHSLIRNADLMLSMRRSTLKRRKIDESLPILESARRNLSLFQHHDAITGTSKVSVMDDYSELLHQSIMDTKSVLEELADGELDLYPRIHDGVEMQTILNFEKNSRAREIKIFNSQLFTITDIFEIRVNVGDGGGADELLLSIGGKAIQAQIEPYFIKGKVEKDSRLVIFQATIPPLSMIKVRVQKKNSGGKTVLSKLETSKLSDTWKELEGSFWSLKTTKPSTLSLESQFLKTTHDPVTGALQKATNLGSEQTFSCEQSWQKYRDAAGGAYLMRLSSKTTDITSNFEWLKVSGPLRETIYQSTDTVFQRTSVKNVPGPAGEQIDIALSIDISKDRNTELMTRFSTKWPSDKLRSYTDSVGLQLLRREFYNLPVEKNYYPMPTAAVIETEKQRLSIVSNVEHGARFMEHGTVEINIDRILNQDDGKGLGFGSDSLPTDLHPVDMKFKLVFDQFSAHDITKNYSTHTLAAQQAVQNVIYPPIQLISENVNSIPDVDEISENSDLRFPCDLQLLTVRPISDDRELLILWRHATVLTGTASFENCGEKEFKNSLTNLLVKLGVQQVQQTDLSGTTDFGKVRNVENLEQIDLETFDFLTFVLYR